MILMWKQFSTSNITRENDSKVVKILLWRNSTNPKIKHNAKSDKIWAQERGKIKVYSHPYKVFDHFIDLIGDWIKAYWAILELWIWPLGGSRQRSKVFWDLKEATVDQIFLDDDICNSIENELDIRCIGSTSEMSVDFLSILSFIEIFKF